MTKSQGRQRGAWLALRTGHFGAAWRALWEDFCYFEIFLASVRATSAACVAEILIAEENIVWMGEFERGFRKRLCPELRKKLRSG